MIGKDFNWLIVNIDTEEKWDKITQRLYEKGYNKVYSKFNDSMYYNIGYNPESTLSIDWLRYHIERENPKIIECDNFLSKENLKSLGEDTEKVYQGLETWKALVEGKKLYDIETFDDDFVSMRRDGVVVWSDGSAVLDLDIFVKNKKFKEYKKPKKLSHEELEKILGYKFEYVKE